ncbi:hypothetical protein GCM10027521_50630 [Amycolatopsis cihanbeyliensis]
MQGVALSDQAPSRRTRSLQFLGIAIATSLIALLLLPPLGYMMFAAWTVAAWVRRESPITRWLLTIVATVLIFGTILGLVTSTSVSVKVGNSAPSMSTAGLSR